MQVWKDTAESPQPKEKLREMDLFREEYKRFKRKYPQAKDEVLRKKAQQIVELRRGLVEEIGLERAQVPQAKSPVQSQESKVGSGEQGSRAEPSHFPGKPLQAQSPTPVKTPQSIDQLLAEISQTKLR